MLIFHPVSKESIMELEKRNGISITASLGFVVIHLLPVAALWTGATAFDWAVCGFMYFIRMFFVTGVYHRYFSHRTYKTSRFFQFLLACGAQSSLQKGVLWWGAHHRTHHRTSDTPADPHSMKLYGFWYSHLGWILGPDYNETEHKLIQDFSKFPELRFLNKYHMLPAIPVVILIGVLGGIVNGGSATLLLSPEGGLSTILIGFFLSTALLYHGTFSINSIMHYFGKQRYKTGDESRNNLILALVTLGEGWHNNHHYYMSSTRQGFFWWEIDITYYILKMLSFVGLVWDIQEVPDKVKHSNLVEGKQKAA